MSRWTNVDAKQWKKRNIFIVCCYRHALKQDSLNGVGVTVDFESDFTVCMDKETGSRKLCLQGNYADNGGIGGGELTETSSTMRWILLLQTTWFHIVYTFMYMFVCEQDDIWCTVGHLLQCSWFDFIPHGCLVSLCLRQQRQGLMRLVYIFTCSHI